MQTCFRRFPLAGMLRTFGMTLLVSIYSHMEPELLDMAFCRFQGDGQGDPASFLHLNHLLSQNARGRPVCCVRSMRWAWFVQSNLDSGGQLCGEPEGLLLQGAAREGDECR